MWSVKSDPLSVNQINVIPAWVNGQFSSATFCCSSQQPIKKFMRSLWGQFLPWSLLSHVLPIILSFAVMKGCDEGLVLETASTSERRRFPWVAINPVDTFWFNNWCLARHNSSGKLIIFSSRERRIASRETRSASRETGIASRETRLPSRETRFSSRETRLSSREKVSSYLWAVLYFSIRKPKNIYHFVDNNMSFLLPLLQMCKLLFSPHLILHFSVFLPFVCEKLIGFT